MTQHRNRIWAATGLWLWSVLIVGVTGCVDEPEQAVLDGQDVEVVFLHSADIHSRLIPYELDVGLTDQNLGLLQANAPFGGIARLAAIVKQERRDNPRFAYLESGDVFQGAPVFNYFSGEPEFRALTQMGVDVFTIGNHEFDNGATRFVEKALKWARFPMVAANYLTEDPNYGTNALTGKVTRPYVIMNLRGLKVGVVGIGDLSSMRSVFKSGNSLGITPIRTQKVLQDYVDFLRPMVDLVVVTSHAGYHEDLNYIPRVEGIDIVFGGHLHIALDPPNTVQDCDIAKLEREKDLYKCDTEEKLRVQRRECEAKNECDSKATAAEKTACQDACRVEADKACKQQMESSRYVQKLAELDDDISFLRKRGCHPRNVLLVHSGAFLKFVGKLKVVLRQCMRLTDQKEVCAEQDALGKCVRKVPRRCTGRSFGRNDWEVIASNYQLIPMDRRLPDDPAMDQLLEPYKLEFNRMGRLTEVLGFSANRLKRFSAGSGDSEVGNMLADSMQVRNQVWADFAITNALGIRSDIVPGALTEEQMTNVFPFENTLTVMYLSGYEVQELMDFVTGRSTNRGCQSQAQVAGLTATLNCSGCPGNGGNKCLLPGREYNGDACAQRVTIGGSGRPCLEDKDCEKDETGKLTGEICTGQRHPLYAGKNRCWLPISCTRSYRLSTNDYIARGGSGFQVLQRNTTQKNLGISLRASAKDYIAAMPACSRVVDVFDPATESTPRAPRYVITADEQQWLKDMESLALSGTDEDVALANADFQNLRAALTKRLDKATDAAEKTGLNNFLACTKDSCDASNPNQCGLAAEQVKECSDYSSCASLCNPVGTGCAAAQACLKAQQSQIAKCAVLGRVRAALHCLTLPCINAKEDGRLQRVFRDSSGSPDPDEPWPE